MTGIKVHPHLLRHTAGNMLHRKCKDMKMLMDFLGHKSVSTTLIYISDHDKLENHGVNLLEI